MRHSFFYFVGTHFRNVSCSATAVSSISTSLITGASFIVQQERREREQQHLQKREEYQAEQKRLLEERKRREAQKRRQDMEEIEKKQAMDKIAALKKTTVGAKALKDLTQEVSGTRGHFTVV